MKSISTLLSFLIIATFSRGQTIGQLIKNSEEHVHSAGCGSYHIIEHIDAKTPGFLDKSNEALEQMSKQSKQISYKRQEQLTIPVVFHVVYNDSTENIPDSVIQNQLEILNNAFNHTHADTGNLRDEFKPIAGNANIQFVLATEDPNGKTTTGIVRQNTSVKHFGGTLPYKQSEQAEIRQWLADSFYQNLFRITSTADGGSDEWDPTRYINIWIGDLRIYEPEFNDLEELVFVGLATPPSNHRFWDVEFLPADITATGALIHYPAVGSNNPNKYPAPYGVFNSSASQGKIVVHEVGHYLGLRHIWGDGTDCTVDDFIDDTPLCTSSSNFGCQIGKNTCGRGEDGDMPDMVENYMDYARGDCALAFTKQQTDVMRLVWKQDRQWPASTNELEKASLISIYPNPSTGSVNLESYNKEPLHLIVKDLSGKVLQQMHVGESKAQISLPTGVFVIESHSQLGVQTSKVIVQ
ncbi:MAG: zinc-dependent metalloprotease [Bacteroidetes bacterium]|nr:zinc-dependent metalloprotease [Bacteroidota bacterium]